MEYTPTLPAVVDVATVAALLAETAPIKLIDVRTPAEFESLHIPGSYNVPLDLLPEHRAELRDTVRSPVVLVCQSGHRARQAEQVLREVDLPQVHVLDGGVAAWEAAHHPLNRGRQRWSLERQVRGLAGSIVLVATLGSLFWKPLTAIATAIGAGLAYSALSNRCGMALVLSRLPYNQGATCDLSTVLRRLADDAPDIRSGQAG
ncbi:MAG TPA: rhodanese-like domain-containing protein [Herpetosiphonaceae bacterium]